MLKLSKIKNFLQRRKIEEDSFKFQINEMTIEVKAVFQNWRLKIYVTIDSPEKFHFEMLKD